MAARSHRRAGLGDNLLGSPGDFHRALSRIVPRKRGRGSSEENMLLIIGRLNNLRVNRLVNSSLYICIHIHTHIYIYIYGE